MYPITLMVLGLMLSLGQLMSQNLPCGTPELDPFDPVQRQFNRSVHKRVGKAQMATRVIPVAVHVVHSGGTSSGNISLAQIESQFFILNGAFRGGYGGVDTHIEFCLAGVNRIENADLASTSTSPADELDLKNSIQEDPQQFLNVWIVEDIAGGVLGYATFPTELGQHPQLDGVVIRNQNWGVNGTAGNNAPYDLGMTAVHEIGHWLHLFHVFQGGCDDAWTCEFSGDCCCDTPPQEEPWYGCRKKKNSCSGDNPDERDPVQNFMGYSDDDCMEEFTICQAGRMWTSLDSIRHSTWFLQGADCPTFKNGLNDFAKDYSQISVSPNPATGSTVVRLHTGAAGNYSMVLYDILGVPVSEVFPEQNLEVGAHAFSLDSPGPGVYLLYLKGAKVPMVHRVVFN